MEPMSVHYDFSFPTEKTRKTAHVREETDRYFTLLEIATARLNRELEALEKRCSDPSEHAEELLRATEKAIDTALASCAAFEEGVKDGDVIRNARITFRERTNRLLSKSYCLNRTRTWPQGSQGDYKTLDIIYRNTPMSDGIGYYLDRYMLSAPLATGVRERIAKLEELLREELVCRQAPKILDVACGSCREVLGLVPEIEASGAQFTCIDLDSEALDFAMNRLSYAGFREGQVEFLRYNALRMFDHEMNMQEFGMQDIIYSVGFFDYLPDDFLTKLLSALYLLLKPGGKLIASFKDANRYKSQPYHWLGDWDGFLQRNETDFKRILSDAGIPHFARAEARVESGTIIFYTVTKQ